MWTSIARRSSTAWPGRTSSTPSETAIAIDELDDDLALYLGAARDAAMLEVVSLLRTFDREDLVIHAMVMRTSYRRLLPGGDNG